MRDPAVLAGDIREYLEAENAYTDAQLADVEDLKEALFAEMKGRIKEDDSSVPSPDGPWAYYVRYETGQQYPLLCRQPRGGGEEEVLLDGNKEAEGKSYWSLGAVSHSPDHRLLAYTVDDKGSELYTVRFRDLARGVDLDDAIPDTRGNIEWSADSGTLYYVRLDANHRPLYVYRHTLGTADTKDALVYAEADIGFYVGIGKTHSGDWLTISAHDHQTSEVYVVDAHAPASKPRLIAEREHEHEYDVEHNGELFYILTNSGGAEDFRICTAPVTSPGRDNWQEYVAHKPGRLILSHVLLKDHLIRLEREEGLPRIIVRALGSGEEHAIAFDEEAYSLGMSPGYEFDTTSMRFTYSSMTTPQQVYDYDVESRARVLRKTQEVPSGHDPADYVTRRLFAPAGDGELVPISLLYRKDTALDGTAPLFLYGYGSYGITIPAGFSTNRLSLVDRGFVFAIAHIRGGKDKGYRWYRDGKLRTKKNTFTDFIAAGEFLAQQRFTSRGRIVASGGSAGGMLMGAVANMAPDLFLGIVADVPFVDVLNTMLDESLPLTPPEWLEWGNPIASAEEYENIQSYSPYDNVEAKAYPHIFALGGLTDPRVTYWEPAKWVARLRARKTDSNLLLLKINMEAGHGGASGRFEALKEIALEFAFALKIAGKA
jgi:oligopeptidase B